MWSLPFGEVFGRQIGRDTVLKKNWAAPESLESACPIPTV